MGYAVSSPKVLIVAPHPDDEVLGCGGTIARLGQEGFDIHVLIVTTAYAPDWSEEFIKNRKREIKEAHRILGVRKTHFLNYPTAKLDTISRKKINSDLAKIIEKIKPDIVFLPFKGDLHHDHRIIFEASLVALRPASFRIKKILSYETLSETEWGQELYTFKPNIYFDITNTFEKKVQAIKAYLSELREFPHPRSIEAIEALAKKEVPK